MFQGVDRPNGIMRCVFEIFSAFEELVLRSFRASPFMTPFLMPGGWQELKYVCWKVCAHFKNRVLFDLFESLALIYIHGYVSKNVISVSEISAVNFIVG